jgi:hypothetical protein
MKVGDPEGDQGSRSAPTPGSFPRTASDRYQIASDEGTGSGGYQTGSEQPATPERAPESDSDSDSDSEEMVEDQEKSGGIDPYEALAQAAAETAAHRRREKERADPAIWLPGPDDLDQDLGRPDSETGFSRDRWRRGNPQVSVRLRPMDFDRLRRAADLYGVRPTTLARMMVIRGVRAVLDAELRKQGDEFRNRGNY